MVASQKYVEPASTTSHLPNLEQFESIKINNDSNGSFKTIEIDESILL